jgi:hypothetical protein
MELTIISLVSQVDFFGGKEPMALLASVQIIWKPWQCQNDDETDTNCQHTFDQEEP